MYNELKKILIVVNENNEIVQYASIGELPDSIEYDGTIPEDFRDKFKPSFYMIKDGLIVENPDYKEIEIPAVAVGPSKQDKINAQIMLNQAKQKEDQDKFNAQILLKLAGGMK